MIADPHCSYCQAIGTINQLAQFALPPRAAMPVRNANLMQCSTCRQIYLCVAEEVVAPPTAKINNNQSKEWDVYNYYLPEDLQQETLISATLCLNPRAHNCDCPMHSLINEINFFELEWLGHS